MSKLKVDVEVNTAKVAPGLNASTQAVKKWASDLKGTITGAFGGAAVSAAISKTLESIEGMGDSSDRMGRTIQEVQLLAQMAQMAGRELGNVEMMLNNIAEAQVDALNGNESKMNTFRAAGFNEQSLSQTNELSVLQQMAKAFQGKSIAELRGIGVSDVVGKKNVGTFATMQNDFANFSETLRASTAMLLDPQMVQEFKANTDLLNVTFNQIGTQLANTFLPLLTWIINRFHDVYLVLEAFVGGIGRFFGTFGESGKGSGLKGFWEDLKSASSAFGDAFIEAGAKWQERQQLQADAAERVKRAEELSKMGPGMPKPDKDKGKPEKPIWYKVAVPDPITGSVNGLPQVGRGGFMGANLGLLGQISRETTTLLKQIEKNTRKRQEATDYNNWLEMMGRLFGVTVR